jgi:fatty-acid peroxygenase
VADWRDDSGTPLALPVAAVELLNLVRPIVAVALFAEFALLALALRPELHQAFAQRDFTDLDGFVHEVRRRAPFFPLIAGRARRDLEWQGEVVAGGTWTLLDLYGTNHDARLWPRPNAFDPGRYARGEGDARHIVAQGAGDYLDDHRCPGEPMTEALLAELVRVLSPARWWATAGQRLEVTWGQMPARVRDGLELAFP